MASSSNYVTVLSANCQGLRDKRKRFDVFNYFKKKKANIICLQDTHLTKQDEKLIRHEWNNDLIINGTKTNSRGTLILFDSQFEYKIINVHCDDEGNLINLDIKVSDMKVKLLNIYAPNQDRPTFFEKINDIIHTSEQDYTIICGDFNLILDPIKDCQNYANVNNPQARKKTILLIAENNLIDSFRYFHENQLRYTWRKKNSRPLKQARLDYIIISDTLLDLVENCDIVPGYRSDHSIVTIKILINKFTHGKGLWKFNTSLLKNKDYLNLINHSIEDEILKYVVPVYNLDELKNISAEHIHLRIDDRLFLEMLYLRIRGDSIKFASHLKKKQLDTEQKLINEIQQLEINLTDDTVDLLNDKMTELENLRNEKIKGHMVRSRIKWLNEGEKPSKYFCNLENKRYLEKTIKRLQLADGEIITDQKVILHEVKCFYEKLFSNKDDNLLDENIEIF